MTFNHIFLEETARVTPQTAERQITLGSYYYYFFLSSSSVMTSPHLIHLQSTFSAAWLVNAGPPCPVGALSVQTVINLSAPTPRNPQVANQTGATPQGQPVVP